MGSLEDSVKGRNAEYAGSLEDRLNAPFQFNYRGHWTQPTKPVDAISLMRKNAGQYGLGGVHKRVVEAVRSHRLTIEIYKELKDKAERLPAYVGSCHTCGTSLHLESLGG